MTDRSLPLWKSLLFWGITVVGIPILVLLLIEGTSSFILFARELSKPVKLPLPAAHTDYDTLLGWVNRRGFFDRDLYGHGIYFRTNAQRFRNDHDFTTAVPPGRVRLICSGDSFTLGYEVDNEHAWCAVLERKHPRLETVNMGQGGTAWTRSTSGISGTARCWTTTSRSSLLSRTTSDVCRCGTIPRGEGNTPNRC